MNASAVRDALVLPRPNTWTLFVLLLTVALGSEYWDKDPISLGGILLPWPRFVLAMLVVPLLVPRSERRWSALRRIPRVAAPMMVFWLCCGLSLISVVYALGSSSIGQFLKTFLHLTLYIGFVLALVKWITWPRLSLLVKAYYLLGIAAATLALLQFAHGHFGLFGWMAPLQFQSASYDVGAGLNVGFRTASFFGEPSWAARYYVHFMALALAFWWHTGARWHLAVLGLLVLAFYTANSLLGYVILGTFAVALVLTQMWRRNMFSLSRGRKAAIAAAAYAFLLLWLLGATPQVPDLIGRSISRVGLVMQGGGSAGNRIDSVFAGLKVWYLAPVGGVGLGNVDRYISVYYEDPAWVLRSSFGSDSLYVQLLAEVGIIGLVAFLWFWIRLLWFAAPSDFLETASPEMAQTYLWLRFLQFDMFAQGVGMVNAADYLNPHFWTVVAIVLACKTLLIAGTRPAPAAFALA